MTRARGKQGEMEMKDADERYWQRQEAKHRRYRKWVEEFYKLRNAAIERDGLEAVEEMEKRELKRRIGAVAK
jgi:deoxyadenosine/deoxycytidine kinase